MKAMVLLSAMVIALACCKPKEKLMMPEAGNLTSSLWKLQ